MNEFRVEQQPVTRANFLTSTVCVRTSALLSSLVVKVCLLLTSTRYKGDRLGPHTLYTCVQQ